MNLKLRVMVCLAGALLIASPAGLAQQWQPEVVEGGLFYPWGEVGDFDNDNDADLLFMDGETLIWYENLLPGWTRHTIDSLFPNATEGTFEVLDLDQDGDLDFTINSSGNNPGTLAWYENRMAGGQWEKHIISSTLNNPSNRRLSFGDIDGDNDIDIACPTWGGGEVFWFENVAGDTLWKSHQVAILGSSTVWTTLADIDGDSDPDILAGRYFAGNIVWYENQLPDTTWPSSPIITLPGTGLGQCVDMDDDGDVDLVTHSNISNVVRWYENPSWTAHLITSGVAQVWLGQIGDIDQDGDLDVTFGGVNNIGWCENPGSAGNWQRYIFDTIVNNYPVPMGLIDINLDTYPDVVAATSDFNFIGEVRWYANPAPPTGITESYQIPAQIALFQNYPNPFNPTTVIRYQLPQISDIELTVYDLLGKKIREWVNEQQPIGTYKVEWDGKDDAGIAASSGVYLYRLKAGSFIQTRKMVLLR